MVPLAVQEFMKKFTDALINPLLALLFGLALLYFLYGLTVFLMNRGEESKMAEGRQHMLWGVIGLVVMVSVFGLIQLLLSTFGVGSEELPSTFITPASDTEGSF